MTPTWYDLLGVEPDAPAEEIRVAWRSAIADLDPGDRRFRTLNEAAEVLLDADRRAAYDRTLEAEPAVAEPPLAPAPVLLDKAPADAASSAESPAPQGITDLTSERDRARAEAKEQRARARQEREAARTTPRRVVPAWLLAALAVLTAAALVAAGYLVSQPSDDAIATSTSEAQTAAERAASTLLAYGWQTMDEDQKAADALLTASYRKKFDQLFAVLKENQPSTKTDVKVDKIVASGIVRSGEDRVSVLVFLNRSRTNATSTEPVTYRDQVVMTMVKSDGDWLVDNMNTNQLAS